jgi:tetratricopeptide (TPR) repeat protein
MKHLFLLLVVISLSGFGQTAEDYYNKGISKFSLKDYTGAITDYKKCIQLNSDYYKAYYNRGNVKYYLKDKNGACADWSKAGELGYSEAYTSIKKYCQ